MKFWATADDDRGLSPVVGVVLLVGLVVTTAAVTAVMGGMALDTARNSVELQNGEHTMREVDSRLSQVAFSANDAHTLDFSGQGGEARVTPDGNMTITAEGDAGTCETTLRFGTIEYATQDGRAVAYQAGGVWKRTESGTTMLSPPDIQYENGTFSFQLVNVTGSVEGPVTELQANKDAVDSREKSAALRKVFGDPACNPPKNMTLTVHSEYHDAWARYFEEYLGGTVSVDDDASTASVEVVQFGSSIRVNDGSNSVESGNRFTAETEVLGTELSGINGGNVIYGPITMRVKRNDTALTPWPDGDVDDPIDGEPANDDLSDPSGPEQFSYEMDGKPGTSVTVEATSWQCGGWEDTGQNIEVDGGYYDQLRCSDVTGEDIRIDSDENTGNLVLLQDGDEVPDFNEAGAEQRGLEEILGDRINDTGHLVLARNEVVLLYELSAPNAHPDDADGDGDPDYNDAVVLLTINEKGGVGVPENFAIHVSVNEVVITKSD